MEDNKWNMIPTKCLYFEKEYNIVAIDLQGGYFTLYNPNADKGEIMIYDVDMEKCNPINKNGNE